MPATKDHGHFGQGHLLGWVPSLTREGPFFDPLTTSAQDLSKLLASGKITSVQILNDYYRQILDYNGYVNAVLQLAPEAMERAKELDDKRSQGHILGPLHGIPILLKDNIGTEVGMKMVNTGCNIALIDSYTTKNSVVVDRLVEAGAIIMGKTTLSEMMNFKGNNIRCGWASLNGQCQNPYVKGGVNPNDGLGGHSSPDGSSSGSAAAVAAGMAPIALGTETAGSLVLPAVRQSLYAIKPTLGSVANEGVMPISISYDIVGPLAKTVQDMANVLSVISDRNQASSTSESEFVSAVKGNDGWKELRIGTLAPGVLAFDASFMVPVPEATKQLQTATDEVYKKFEDLAAKYEAGLTLPELSAFTVDGQSAFLTLWLGDFEADLNSYLSGTEGSNIRTLEHLTAWNRDHADVALPPEFPSQALFDAALKIESTSVDRQKYLDHIASVTKHLDDAFEKHGINVIVAPGDSRLCQYSAAAGYPVCAIPIGGIEYIDRRVGLTAIAKSETTLITLMSALEATLKPREPPTAFLGHGDLQVPN